MVLDILVDLVTPAFVNLVSLSAGAFLANSILMAAGATWLMLPFFFWSLIIAGEFLYVFTGLFAARADRGAYAALFNFPKYAFWKMRLYLNTIFRGDDKKWVRTARERTS